MSEMDLRTFPSAAADSPPVAPPLSAPPLAAPLFPALHPQAARTLEASAIHIATEIIFFAFIVFLLLKNAVNWVAKSKLI